MLGQTQKIICRICGRLNVRGSGLRAFRNPRRARLCEHCCCDLQSGRHDATQFWILQVSMLFLQAFLGIALVTVGIVLPLELVVGARSEWVRSLLDSSMRLWLFRALYGIGALTGFVLGLRRFLRLWRLVKNLPRE